MSEKISIKNFGGLKDIEFEFKAINILIGHQASGKSVVVKLMYFFKGFINDIAQNIGEENYFDSFRKIQLNKFELYFPQHTWHDEYFEIQYFLQENMNIKVIGEFV